MSDQARQTTLIAVMLALLLVTAWWSYSRYADARRRAADADRNMMAVTALADEIAALRRQRTMGVQELSGTQLTAILQAPARAVGLDPERVILSIRPQPDRRIENTSYRQKTTELRLQGLTLEELVRFLHDLSLRNPGLHVNAMQLSSPTDTGPAATWTVDPLTLSYFIYSPDPAAERRADSR